MMGVSCLSAIITGHLDGCQMGKSFGTRYDRSCVASFNGSSLSPMSPYRILLELRMMEVVVTS